MNDGFRVLVPVVPPKKVRGRHLRCVSYPASRQSLYTREQAVNLLKRLYERCPWPDGDEREPWAENERERFTLHYPENFLDDPPQRRDKAMKVIPMTAAAEPKSGVVFSPDMKTAVHTVGNGNVFTYKEYNGVYYKSTTPDEVVRVLDSARRHRTRLRLHYGHTEPDHPECGRDWMEENDVEGCVSNSVGPLKVPILVHNARSDGGIAILDIYIIKITTAKSKRVLYQHPKYNRPTITVREIEPGEKVGDVDLRAKGYTHTVCFDSQMTANFKSLAAAQRFVQKMS